MKLWALSQAMNNLVKKVKENVNRYKLLEKASDVIVGVSGGPDSVCLLDVLHEISSTQDFEIHIAHVNYQLRGRESLMDEKFVRGLAKKYNVRLHVKRVKIKEKLNLEEKARFIRYDLFKKVRSQLKSSVVAVGHNLNDQAETVLMRLIRGSGLEGLQAMSFKRDYIIRPLLNISRHEILEYIRINKLKYRIDRSNLSDTFYRNRVRRKLIPYLEKNFNKNIRRTLFNFSQTAADDYDCLARGGESGLKQASLENGIISISRLLKLHPAVRRQVIRRAIIREKSDLRDVEFAHIEEILKIVQSVKNKPQSFVSKRLKVKRKGDKLTVQI